ncbi:hypothetical protein [Clostridium sp.]|uniref:hypothetical protein n=1 Tax=Clostridium sp. TaxID=1506 RepID=UPI002FCB4993
MDKFSILLAIVIIVLSLSKYIKAYKHTKDCEGVIRIRHSKMPTIIFLIMALFQLFINSIDITVNNISFKDLLYPLSNALPWLVSALAYYDYNFITSNGVIINGKKYNWKEIMKWDYKKDFFNIIVFEVLPKKQKDNGGMTYLATIELKISSNSMEEVETFLSRYLGEKGCDSFYVDSF